MRILEDGQYFIAVPSASCIINCNKIFIYENVDHWSKN